MRKIALIPARFGSTRFPGKLLANLSGKPVIVRTYEATVKTGLFDEVAVVCDSEIIFQEVRKHGGNAVMSKKEHECGTDRIAEAAEHIKADIVVNVQGDEPFTKKEPLEKLLRVFEGAEGRAVQVASLMQEMNYPELIADPNYVKVAVDRDFNALFFSRSPIPYLRNESAPVKYYEHIGVYAFRRQMLLDFTRMPVTPLENAEKIECLRYLENGIRMKMVVTDYMGVEIDTPEDLVKAESLVSGL